jgi:hypothetical protein
MKPIKDTKLGVWLKEHAPKILDKVGELLPDQGVLGIVKNLISSDTDLSPELQMEALRLHHEFEMEVLKDVQSARLREVEFVKATGHMDYFMYIFGGVSMVLFGFTIYVSATGDIPGDMREIFIESRARVSDLVMMIAAYYWGSSAGSRVKDMLSRK